MLGISVVTPFSLDDEQGSNECLAFLPHFGGPNGMIIGAFSPPSFKVNQRLVLLAGQKRYFWSFVNPIGYSTFKSDEFKCALNDWGFFGPEKLRPCWLPK